MPYLILRFGTAYGWSPRMREDLLVNMLARAAAKGEQPEIFDTEARRPFVHCRDFSSALRHALRLDCGRTVNVVSENFSKKELISRLEGEIGRPFRFSLSDRADPRSYLVSNRLATELGFSFAVRMESGVRELVAHYA
jgi:nucleoside-diphosphate-sugar epimerase